MTLIYFLLGLLFTACTLWVIDFVLYIFYPVCMFYATVYGVIINDGAALKRGARGAAAPVPTVLGGLQLLGVENFYVLVS